MSNITLKEKRLGVKDLVQSNIGLISVVGMFYAICCAGAYGIEEMIPEAGPGVTILLLLILPLIWALPYSNICAELGSARPVEGGSIMWVKEALGEFWFAIMVFTNVIWALVCNSVYVVLSVNYLGNIVELTDAQAYIIKLLMVLIFFIINVVGLKEVSVVSTVLSILIILVFAFVAIVGFANWNFSPIEPFMSEEYDGLLGAIGAGIAIGVWMYSGFDEISLMAGEIRDARKVIPKALMIVVPLISLTYLLPTIGGLATVGNWESWTTEPGGVGYATVLTQNLSPVFGIIFMIVAILGQLSIFNVCIATGGRCILILSDQNFGPKFLARLTRKKGTPYVGLVIVAIVTALLIPFDFTFLVLVEVFFMVTVVALTTIAAMILKRRIPKEEVPFQTPGGKVGHTIMAVVIIAICVFTILSNGTDWFLGGLLWILAVPLLYLIFKRLYKGSTVMEPELYPINPKTKLGFGDLQRIGKTYVGIGLFSTFSRFFLGWYEGEWGHEYYLEEYEEGLFSNFDLMLKVILIVGIATIIAGLVFYMAGKKIEK
ncbi:MAG: APC family permease [Anaerovoracaceae bacterium]|nr:APC family permease [Clostridiales bacterium]